MFAVAPGDQRLDPARAKLAAVLVEVIAAIGEQAVRTSPRPAAPPGYRPEAVDQRQKLGDVVAIAAGQRDRERDAVGVGQQVML